MQLDKQSLNKNIRKRLTLFVGLALSLHAASLLAIEPVRAISVDTKDSNNNRKLSARHTAAIEDARAGRLDAALAELATLHQIAPQDNKILSDYLTVLTWANKNTEAVSESKKVDVKNIAEYTLVTLAKAARKTSDFNYALFLYETLAARNPQLIDYKIAHALLQIDGKYYAEAEAEINALKENNPDNVDLLNAQLYLGQQTHSQIKILDASQRLLALDPKNKAVASSLASVASELGATSKSAELGQQYGLESESMQRLIANHAASHIRWGEFEPINPKQPYAETDKALSLLDEACKCDWAKLGLSKAAMRKMIFDRMLALQYRHRSAEVIAHYNQLKAQQVEIPTYVMRAVGGAYLDLREPELALEKFDAILSNEPDLRDTQLDKVYALIELERFDEAQKLAKQIVAAETSYLNRNKNPIVRQNDNKLQADVTAALVLAYGDDLARSEKMFAALQKIGPNNVELKNNLATIWRWRGWLDLAAQTYQKILSDEKDNLQAKYGLANTHMDGRDWALAEQEIKDLNGYIAPENPSLKALNKRWELHNKRQFVADFSTGKSSGSALGSKSNNANAWLYSAPFNYNYRAFINTGYSYNTFPEGNGRIVTPNIGLEYRSHDWRWATQLGAATADGSGAAGSVTADYRANDYWSFNGGLELNSQQTPVRGQRVGIDGNAINIGATYRWSELMQASASANLTHMSDSNTRQGFGLALDRRLYTAPHYKANIRFGLNTSQNSLNNATYFNPKSDLSLGATLSQDWLTWRRYDRSFTQRLSLTGGNYQQENFGSKGTWSISYSHAWELDNLFGLEYGISHSSQPYDGIRESNNALFGHINLLF